jgi:transcriptional regulator with XRE-family HTH domain
MASTSKAKSLLERELENEQFRRAYEEGYEAFQLETQILYALEKKRWTYTDLAKATNTSKSNVSRDLSAGKILSASFSRIGRIADALGMKLVGLLIPKEQLSFVLPQIEALVKESANAAFGKVKLLPTAAPLQGYATSAESQNAAANSKQAQFTITFSNNPILA